MSTVTYGYGWELVGMVQPSATMATATLGGVDLGEIGDLLPWLTGVYALILVYGFVSEAVRIIRDRRTRPPSRHRRAAANPLGRHGGDAGSIA